MAGGNIQNQRRRAFAGLSTPVVVIVLVIVAVCGGIVAYRMMPSSAGQAGTDTPRTSSLSQDEIDAKLHELQQVFQDDLQAERDLSAIQGDVQAFIERAPDEPGGHVLLGQVLVARELWEPAYQAWARALELDAALPGHHKMAGFCAAKIGRNRQALTHYRGAVTAAGGKADSEVYASLGRLHLSLKDPTAAHEAFTNALSAPGPGEKTNWKHAGYAGLADVASVQAEHDKALGLIDRALRLAGHDSQADVVGYHIQKARLYMDANRDDDAVTWLSHAKLEHPEMGTRLEAVRLRARLYDRADELNRAVNHIALACKAYQYTVPDWEKPKLANLYALLARWQIKAGQKDDALRSLDSVRSLEPKHPAIAELRKLFED